MNQINVNISQNKNSISAGVKNVVPINPAKGTFKINKNGKFNVKEFEFADVNVVNVNIQKKSLTISKNGSYEIMPDENFFLEKASVSVNVPIPEGYVKPSGTLSVEKNDIYDVKNYEKVNVEVPIPSGYIKPEGTINITSNGEVDVKNYEKANVNIAFDNILNEYLAGTKTKITKEDLKEITEIRDFAFYGAPITEVEFTKDLKILGQYAFFKTQLLTINLDGITQVSQYAFCYNPFTELVLPSSITTMGQRCFENCKQLKKITIECTRLSPYMFQHATALEEIICLLETPPTIYTTTFTGTTCPIKVRADLVEKYKSATNWTTVADRIVAYEGD